MSENLLIPKRGIHAPSTSTPARRPCSVRRTTSVDIERSRCRSDLLQLRGAGVDVVTDKAGEWSRAGGGAVDVDVDLGRGRTVTDIADGTAAADLTPLIGLSAASGFRKAAKGCLASHRQGSVIARLLDDVPVATVISGYALTRELSAEEQLRLGGRGALARADYCAGFAAGGTMMTGVARDGAPPLVDGPQAPDLVGVGAGWHPMSELGPGSMRRIRRIDVSVGDDAELSVDAMFRDTYMNAAGIETVVHEYGTDVLLDSRTLTVRRLTVTPRVLPWPECPGAVAGAQRLVGRKVTEIEGMVGSDFHGIGSCTHLNDLLRSLGDLSPLAVLLPGPDNSSAYV
ncbi:DUF2889 domain-containing protein [Rhodococcus sp. NPDC019627]|uniref:DUF2889 domain-containing protein n=1 Tax=unclassified Rhodococcus (in: high G+C Gram-positive bacteria) TaxID=192944 RepID=UPI0033F443C6